MGLSIDAYGLEDCVSDTVGGCGEFGADDGIGFVKGESGIVLAELT